MLKKIVQVILGVISIAAIGYGFFNTDTKGNDPVYFVAFVASFIVTIMQLWPTRKNDKISQGPNSEPIP